MTRRTFVAIGITLPIEDVPWRHGREPWATVLRKRAGMRKVMAALSDFAFREGGPVETPANLVLRFAWSDRRKRNLANFDHRSLVEGLVIGGMVPKGDAHVVFADERLTDTYKPGKGLVRITAELRTVGALDVPEAEEV